MTDIHFYKSNKQKKLGFRIDVKNVEKLDPEVRAAIDSIIHEVEYPRQTKLDEWRGGE